jgi:Raf kinase inhibitor-like YbhB/YbcL family protein
MNGFGLTGLVGGVLIGLILGSCNRGTSTAEDTDDQKGATDELPVLNTMTLTGSGFDPSGVLPTKYTCDGDGSSPALSWDAPPDAARSLVLLVHDPDASPAPGKAFVHWVLYGLPPTVRQLPEKLPAQPFLTIGGMQGKNDFGKYGYGGACPPSGTHHYLFRLYALDKFLDLPPGTGQGEVIAAMKGHIVAGAALTEQYSRK